MKCLAGIIMRDKDLGQAVWSTEWSWGRGCVVLGLSIRCYVCKYEVSIVIWHADIGPHVRGVMYRSPYPTYHPGPAATGAVPPGPSRPFTYGMLV